MLVCDLIKGELIKRWLDPTAESVIEYLLRTERNLRICRLCHIAFHLFMLYKVFQVTIRQVIEETAFYRQAEVSPLHHYQTAFLAVAAVLCIGTHLLAITGLALDVIYHEYWIAVLATKVVYYSCAILHDAIDPVWELFLFGWALLTLTPEAVTHFLSLVYLSTRRLELHY